jgi:hypothetical protein
VTEAAHFIVGAAICRHVRCKPLGLLLAFASHFALDAIPHFEHARVLGWASWTPVVAASWLATMAAAVAVWLRFRPGGAADRWTRLYLIAGGLLGGLLDQLKQWMGPSSLAWSANGAAHWWGPWYRALPSHAGVTIALAVAMAVVELAVIALAAWLLFRHAPSGEAPGPSAD